MNLKNAYFFDLLEKGMRMDKRGLDEYRKIVIKNNVIEKAEGSSLVMLGETKVIVGVKMDVLKPFADTPDEGVLIVNAELSPIASTTFELGPPRENAIELARIVDRGIRESKAIDMKKLCIEEGEKVWGVFIDIYPLNHDGNLIDASGIGAISALLCGRIPKLEGEKVVYEEKKEKIPVKKKPVPVTFGFARGRMLVDPCLEEENFIESRMTVTTGEDGHIYAIQKGGTSSLSLAEIESAFELAIKKGKEIRKLI